MSALAEAVVPALAPLRPRVPARPRVTGLAPCDPLADPGWDAYVGARPDATFFHTSAWARVLRDSYGHTPVYFTDRRRADTGPLLPVMEVNSPLTGRQGVSLPFTDWCPPLGGETEELQDLYEQAVEYGRARGWRRLETRGGVGPVRGASPAVAYHGHWLELCADEAKLLAALDPATRRGLRKAQASGLRVESRTDEDAMRDYYRLHCLTRRRHGLPPQPWQFFANIARYVLGPGHGFILSVRAGEQQAAAAVFFHHGTHAIYKFGASDPAFQTSRPNNLVLWEAIRHYAARGCRILHLGRTSLGNEGLRRFKLGFGAGEERLEYCRHDLRAGRFIPGADRSNGWFNGVFRALPLPALRLIGSRLYPHLSCTMTIAGQALADLPA